MTLTSSPGRTYSRTSSKRGWRERESRHVPRAARRRSGFRRASGSSCRRPHATHPRPLLRVRYVDRNQVLDGGPLPRTHRAGAFGRTIVTDRASMKILFNHGKDPYIGDKPIATLDFIEEDAVGAAYSGRLLDASYVRDLVPA